MNSRAAAASSLEVANEFISRALLDDRSLSPMQVQKLVYFADGMSLATLDKPLVSDDFEAWRFGPVIRTLYDALRRYGGGAILRRINYGDGAPFQPQDAKVAKTSLAPPEKRLVDRIYDRFSPLPAFKLSALTHADDSPWAEVYRDGLGQNEVIPATLMKSYFAKLAQKAA